MAATSNLLHEGVANTLVLVAVMSIQTLRCIVENSPPLFQSIDDTIVLSIQRQSSCNLYCMIQVDRTVGS